MQFRNSRQLVTGLIANEKPNVRQEYYRTVRAMCSSLFKTGSYHRMVSAPLVGSVAGDPDVKQEFDTLSVIEGMMGHIYLVRNTTDRRKSAEKKEFPTATRTLYHRLLFYKNFVNPSKPLIITEGKTDPVYLKSAIERRTKFHPRLGNFDKKRFKFKVRFMKFTSTVHDVLQLGRGVEDLKFLILNFKKVLSYFKHLPMKHPIIMIIDNDEGTKEIFSVLRKVAPEHDGISTTSAEKFYRVAANLYLVKTPETGKKKGMTCIEDMFESAVLNTQLKGKVFDPNKKDKEDGKYGKHVFAEEVVRPNKSTIKFDDFDPILERIIAVLDDYAANPTKLP